MEGTLREGSFPAILRALVGRFADGRLDVLSDGFRRTVWLEAGQICAVVSDVEEEKFGRWLIGRGLLQPQQMALALLRQTDSVLYGFQLVADGTLDFFRLQEELEARAIALLGRLLFAKGDYWFAPAERLAQEVPPFSRTTASMLAAAVRGCPDVEPLERWVPLESYLCAVDDVVMIYQKVDLAPHEAYVLSRVDGTTPVRHLRRMLPMGADEATRAMAVLVAVGLVEARPAPAPRPAPPPTVDTEKVEKAYDTAQFTEIQQQEFDEVVKFAGECRQLDHYARLRLSPGATLDQIHASYRSLTRLYHPDRAREDHLRPLRRELAEITASLQDAYDILSNQESKARYDALVQRIGRAVADVAEEEEKRRQARDELVAANVKRARDLARGGDVGEAVGLLDQAVRLHPQAETLLLLADLELRNPMWTQRALDHLRRAVTVSPRCTEAWLKLAAFWASQGEKERVRHCLRKILEYDPGNQDAVDWLEKLGKRSR